MKLSSFSLFKKPLFMTALFSLAALALVFMILKQSNIQKTESKISSYLKDWNYEFSDQVYHKKNYELIKKVLKTLESEPISSYEVTVGGNTILAWSDRGKFKSSDSSCIAVTRSIRISAGPKVGDISFCMSETKIIGRIFKDPIFWLIILLFVVLLALSAVVPLRGYKASLEVTLQSLKAWRMDSDLNHIITDKKDKVSNEILGLFNDGLETKLELLDVKNELKTQAMMTELTRRVAHDLRSPTTAINEIISDSKEFNKNSKDFQIIKASTESLLEICRDLLHKTKEKYKYDNSIIEDIVPLVKEMVNQIKRPNQNVSFQFEGEKKLLAKVNRSDFKRVVSNLLNNAVEATNNLKNGAILISFEITHQGQPLITITDNGCGISEENLQKVSRTGFSFGKENGNGLGLSSAKDKIESWSGRLLITSMVGKGTSVKIYLFNDMIEIEDYGSKIKRPTYESNCKFIYLFNINFKWMLNGA